MPLSVSRPPSVQAFLGEAGEFLAEREAEHNLVLGICSTIRQTPEQFGDELPRFAVVRNGDRVVLASLRTPPYNQVLSEVDHPRAVELLVEALRGEVLPGVLGPAGAVEDFVARWTAQSPVDARLEVAERTFRLDRVRAPERPATGSWRTLLPPDRDVLVAWLPAFLAEALPEAPPLPDPRATADRWIAGEGRIGYVWEDAGEVVSFVGASGETPNGIRIGPVYTPPERRGRGYASALTAAASADQLERGRRFCFLFTDLANPTSNKIYQAIGYEPVCDMNQYRFVDRAERTTG